MSESLVDEPYNPSMESATAAVRGDLLSTKIAIDNKRWGIGTHFTFFEVCFCTSVCKETGCTFPQLWINALSSGLSTVSTQHWVRSASEMVWTCIGVPERDGSSCSRLWNLISCPYADCGGWETTSAGRITLPPRLVTYCSIYLFEIEYHVCGENITA